MAYVDLPRIPKRCQVGTAEDGIWGPDSEEHACGKPNARWFWKWGRIGDRVIGRCEEHASDRPWPGPLVSEDEVLLIEVHDS